MPNEPAIALFLGYAPEVADEPSAMHPLDAAKCKKIIRELIKMAGNLDFDPLHSNSGKPTPSFPINSDC